METNVRVDLKNPDLALDELRSAIRMVKRLHRANKETQKEEKTQKHAPPVPLTPRDGKLGQRAAALIASIQNEIEQNGEATLEVIANRPEWNCSVPSLRGTMMNALRVLRHKEQGLPFVATWNEERNCVVYTAKGAE